jgi:hypothetical protein
MCWDEMEMEMKFWVLTKSGNEEAPCAQGFRVDGITRPQEWSHALYLIEG